jgi:replicative DNA helicase
VPSKSSDNVKVRRALPSLQSIQVDVTTRMGAFTPATPTGFGSLDEMLLGGLRTGTLAVLSGEEGVGKTALTLLIAYMAARARAAVMFASVTLDETEVMARLAARALYRDYPESVNSFGSIWSGEAWRDDYTRAAVATSVNTAVSKVGQLLHLHRARPFESTSELADDAIHLWARYDRVVLAIDGLEAFCAAAGGDPPKRAAANASFANRVTEVAYELRQIADNGCAVVASVHARNAALAAPAATLAAELRRSTPRAVPGPSARHQALGARPVDLVVTKNQLGPTGGLPLTFVAGASVFEERAT